MTVDRSYSEYEAVRTYHDRGMMKWGAFATGELSEAQKQLMEEEGEESNEYDTRNC
ncbi:MULTISPECIES: hypothetical protein [Lactococcus]|uniref:hypothetical protein n=1 Tax=Lactococcus TaxID=1357 RepID=UPI00051F9423|nr:MULTISPECIES: hypothetical protein [Lactococcus]QQB43172.1 hypothetical protein I6H59_00015 [Lactococcus garvieae]CEF52419.1 hypothetical protein LGMT14_02351 [Lactococcus garvieae]